MCICLTIYIIKIYTFLLNNKSARLAQSVERETLNLKVAGSVSLNILGSSPVADTNKLADPRIGL